MSGAQHARPPRRRWPRSGRRARRWGPPQRTPPARSVGEQLGAAGAVSPGSARSRRTTTGPRASSSDVSVRPAWASPPGDRRAAPRQHARRPSALQRGHGRGDRVGVAAVAVHEHDAGEVRRPSGPSSTSTALERVEPDRQRAGEPGVLAAGAVGERPAPRTTSGRAAARPLGQGHGDAGVGVERQVGPVLLARLPRGTATSNGPCAAHLGPGAGRRVSPSELPLAGCHDRVAPGRERVEHAVGGGRPVRARLGLRPCAPIGRRRR